MTEAILLTFAALMIFFVLTEILTIRLFLGENYIVEINFIVFAVVFKKAKSYRKSRRLKKKKERDKIFRSPLIISLLHRSEVKINLLRIFISDSTPSKNAIRYGIYTGLVFSFLAFLENNSKFFEASNITLSHSEHNNLKKQLEAEFKISLLDVLITVVSFYVKEVCYRLFARRITSK